MRFWRYKLLEMAAALAMFPLFVLVGFTWFAVWLQFVDIEQNRWAFFLIAPPFLIGWLIFINRLTRKAEQRWLARRLKKDSACFPKS